MSRGFGSKVRHRAVAAAPGTSAGPTIEPLESRTLLALAAGFESVKITRVVTDVATSMEFAPNLGDGVTRLFVADSNNRKIVLLKNGVLQSTAALTFTASEVDRARERGIESIVFDPNFVSNKFVYLYYTKPDPAKPNVAPSNAATRLVRYTMNAGNDTINKSSALVLLDNMPNPNGIHNGGAMRFGPDGMLYLAVGDGGISTESQNLDRFGGKVLRLNVSNPAQLAPTDNPFYSAANGIGARDYIWAYGFRNPYTGNFKPGTSTLFINDVGGSQWEEINSVQKGKNYGWPNAEGNSSNSAYTNPVFAYTHFPNGTTQPRVPAAITGGAFYDGGQFPASYIGKYFFGDQVRKIIRVFDPATGAATTFHDNDDANLDVLDFDVAPDGTLWTLSTGGNIRRIRYVGSANRAPVAVAGSNKTSGATPLTVNFSGLGTTDADGDTLSYRWAFGDGATATGRDVQHVYNTGGTFVATLTVTDGNGGSDTADPITIIAGSQSPVATITTPSVGGNYGGGQTIGFSGTGTDQEDGTLPASAFEWKVVFHHDGHTHPFIDSISDVKSGSFTIPAVGENDPDQFYRIHLTVTDSDGVDKTTTRDIAPRTSTMSFVSNATGTQFSLDNPPQAFPASILGVEGMTRNLGAATTQVVGEKTFQFVSWSDGGAANHAITTPVNDTTYTATFNQTAGPVDIVRRAVADAYVRDGSSASTNFGTSASLDTKKSVNSGNTREAYLRFDLSGVPVGTGQTVKLRLFGALNNTINSNLAVGVYSVSNVIWSETGITWNSKPGAGSQALDSETITNTTKRWYEWDLTNYVKNEKALGRNAVSFALKRTAASDSLINFSSDEAAINRPELVIAGSTTPPGQAPFKGSPFAVGASPVTIQAEDYDLGGQGIAYNDTTSNNIGGQYRADRVDIKRISGTTSQYRISDAVDGEWLEYTINVALADTYTFEFRVGSRDPGAAFHVEIGGVNVTGTISVPVTGSFDSFTLVSKAVALSAGQQVVRFVFDQPGSAGYGAAFDWMRISPA